MKRTASLVLILALLSACASGASGPAPVSPAAQRTLTVFAAASLTDAFQEIATEFESTHPGVNVSLNFAGSNTLRAQIEAGARADVFASANTNEMEALAAKGLVRGTPQIFLTNQLVLITPENNPATLSRLGDLSRPGLKLVLAAEDVPAGRYTLQVLENAGGEFKARVLENVVSNENTVRQVVAKVHLGEADAGIVYASDAVAAPGLKVIEIPAENNVLAEYPITTLANAAQPELADEFIASVLSPEGQSILVNWGFSTY